jgi:hypothetical protein
MSRAEVSAERSLDLLAPAFRVKVEAVLADVRAKGLDPMVSESVRTADRQACIYGKGRTLAQVEAAGLDPKWAWPDNPDGKCTNAASHLSSVHGHGLAVDIISKTKQWDAPKAFWDAIGASALKHGLTWGGTWKNPHDLPHIQWKLVRGGVAYQGPSAADRERTAAHGMAATWKFYGADTLTPAKVAA